MGRGHVRPNHFMHQNRAGNMHPNYVRPFNPQFGPMAHAPFHEYPYGYSVYPEHYMTLNAPMIRPNGDHAQPFMPYASAGFYPPVQPEFRAHDAVYIGRNVNWKQHYDRPPATYWEYQLPNTAGYISLDQNQVMAMPFAGPPMFPPSGFVEEGASRGVFDYPAPYPETPAHYSPNYASNPTFRATVPPVAASNRTIRAPVPPIAASNPTKTAPVPPIGAPNPANRAPMPPNAASVPTSRAPMPPNAASVPPNSAPMKPNAASDPTVEALKPTGPPDELKVKILKQIEYYFCDENLSHDTYLKSLMDEKGWVPIFNIAKFNRIRSLCIGVPFILDALKSSLTIELQGYKVRRRGEWSKWIQAPKSSNSLLQNGDGSSELSNNGSLDSLSPDSLENSSNKTGVEHVTPETQLSKEYDAFKNNNSSIELHQAENDSDSGASYPVKLSISSDNSEYGMRDAIPQNFHDDLKTIKKSLFDDSSINRRFNEITLIDQAIKSLIGHQGDAGFKDGLITAHTCAKRSLV